MKNLKFTATIKLNERGRDFYDDKCDFIESKVHEVTAIDLKHNMITIADESGESVETIFPDYCEILNVQ